MDLFLGHPQLELRVNEITYPSHILDTGPLQQRRTPTPTASETLSLLPNADAKPDIIRTLPTVPIVALTRACTLALILTLTRRAAAVAAQVPRAADTRHQRGGCVQADIGDDRPR